MNIDDMITILEAAKRGEQIETRYHCEISERSHSFDGEWRFDMRDYRIAPKQMALVEELRDVVGFKVSSFDCVRDTCLRAADRIEELEKSEPIVAFSDRELLEEVKRRMT